MKFFTAQKEQATETLFFAQLEPLVIHYTPGHPSVVKSGGTAEQ